MKKAIIIGAGPAGLTAAYELLTRSPGTEVVIYESSGEIGGISRTVTYKGNRMDIGGHRFFSKSDRVMQWWMNILPLEQTAENNLDLTYRGNEKKISLADYPATGKAEDEKLMLVRNRLSRIFYLKKFFDYPLKINGNTFRNLGLVRIAAILASYASAKIRRHKKEVTLEDFFINRFGKKLYRTFFEDYTQKVWGRPCREIPAEWGAQRIKQLSVSKALWHAVKSGLKWKNKSLSQKNTDTSLIERFLYPKYGPGQMWEEVAALIVKKGGTIHLNSTVRSVILDGEGIAYCEIEEAQTGRLKAVRGDWFLSTMPVKDLVAGMQGRVPVNVREIAEGLQYRDFITIGVLVNKLDIRNRDGGAVKDNWIYVQEKNVRLGRIQIFNNWSPYMVQDASKIWLGLEYFCFKDDDLWTLDDDKMMAFAVGELESIGIIKSSEVQETTIVKVEKTYPAYFGTYSRFDELKAFTDTIPNLFLVGRKRYA